MAKALLGHIGGPDTRLLAEVAMLRRRVRDLEAEVMRLASENDALLAVGSSVGTPVADEIIALDARESVSAAPALA
ncbi:MAG TPA: hypothetical protein VMT88_12060 [Actinomycetes bacterium]|nr:hypothetical protein [Actinomycetes bacterium]